MAFLLQNHMLADGVFVLLMQVFRATSDSSALY